MSTLLSEMEILCLEKFFCCICMQQVFQALFISYENPLLSQLYIHCSSCITFSRKLLLGCLTANFGSLLRGQPHSANVNHCVFTFLTQRPPEALKKGWLPKSGRAPSKVWARKLPILITMPDYDQHISPLSIRSLYSCLMTFCSGKKLPCKVPSDSN